MTYPLPSAKTRKVKPLLLSLSSELPSSEMATLRAELAAHGNGAGQLGRLLSNTICHTLSVFFNPSAGDMMVEAAIKDILEKLKRGAELLEAGAIATPVLPVNRSSSSWNIFSRRTSLHIEQ